MGIDIGLYRQILKECFPDLAISSIEFAGGGSFRVFEVDHTWIFRLPHSPAGSELLRRERRVYHSLQPHLSLPIPHYEFFSEGCSRFPWPVAGYRKLPGEPLQRLDLSPATQQRIAAQLGSFLTELHNIPPAELHEVTLPATTPEQMGERQSALYALVRQSAFPLMSAQQQAWTADLFESFLAETADWHFEPVIIHGDLDSTNILCEPQQGTVTGILDFEDVQLGDAAWDFCALVAEFGPGYLEQLLSTYKLDVDAGFRRRVAFHAQRTLYHELLYGIEHNDHAFLKHGILRLNRAMAGQVPIGGWLDASTSEQRHQPGFPT